MSHESNELFLRLIRIFKTMPTFTGHYKLSPDIMISAIIRPVKYVEFAYVSYQNQLRAS